MLLALDCAPHQPRDELALEEDKDDKGNNGDDDDIREEQVPL